MTLNEAYSCPQYMDFEEYKSYLNKKKKLIKQIRYQSDRIMDCEDALSVLSPVIDERRYSEFASKETKHKKKRAKLEAELNKLNAEIIFDYMNKNYDKIYGKMTDEEFFKPFEELGIYIVDKTSIVDKYFMDKPRNPSSKS